MAQENKTLTAFLMKKDDVTIHIFYFHTYYMNKNHQSTPLDSDRWPYHSRFRKEFTKDFRGEKNEKITQNRQSRGGKVLFPLLKYHHCKIFLLGGGEGLIHHFCQVCLCYFIGFNKLENAIIFPNTTSAENYIFTLSVIFDGLTVLVRSESFLR